MKKLVIALVLGGAALVGTAGSSRAATPINLGRAQVIVFVAQSDLVDLNGVIPPNPVIPVLNRGSFVSSVAIPPNPVIPT